jgi:tetratricopeptide (TPR) repeat protein
MTWRARFIIAVLAITAYVPTLQVNFLWDDHVMIESNPTLRRWTWINLKHDFTHDVFEGHGDAYFRPAQTLMNRVDFTLWGLNPFGFHLTNLLFHMGNSLLIAELALALGVLPLTALVTACFFAVHPIVVEQLMIIAGRAELMGFFFCLVSVLFFLKEDPGWWLTGGLAYGAGLLAKESTLIAPFLIGSAFWYRRISSRKYTRILLLVALTIPYLWLRHRAVGPLLVKSDYGLVARFFLQDFPKVLLRYLQLLAVPWNLHSHRLVPHISHYWLAYLLGTLGLATAWVYYKNRLILFCAAWFVMNLLPKTPVMIFGNFMLEHWVYPASFGFFLLLASCLTIGWNSPRRAIHRIAPSVGLVLLVAWSLLAHLNVALRGSDEKMYRWALYFTTSHPIDENLGILLLQTGRPVEALAYLEEARDAYPNDPNVGTALAQDYWQIGQHRRAYALIRSLLQQHPQYVPALQTRRRMEALSVNEH